MSPSTVAARASCNSLSCAISLALSVKTAIWGRPCNALQTIASIHFAERRSKCANGRLEGEGRVFSREPSFRPDGNDSRNAAASRLHLWRTPVLTKQSRGERSHNVQLPRKMGDEDTETPGRQKVRGNASESADAVMQSRTSRCTALLTSILRRQTTESFQLPS